MLIHQNGCILKWMHPKPPKEETAIREGETVTREGETVTPEGETVSLNGDTFTIENIVTELRTYNPRSRCSSV